MTTFANIVDETMIALGGYTQRQDQATYLTAAMTSTALTISIADGSVVTRGLVEIGDELIWVDSFDRTTNIATIAPYGRGFRDTTPAAHKVGERVTITPSFPRSVIYRNVNNAIEGIYPDLFATYYTQFPFIAVRTTYSLPQEAIDVVHASWQSIGPSKEWLPIRRYRVDRTASPGAFFTGKSISVYDGIVPGRNVMVTYTKKPSPLLLPTDDFAQVTGLPESSREVVVLGAAYRTAAYLDMGRVPAQTAEADSLQANDPVGTAANVSRYIYQLYQQRLAVEVRRQQEQFPPRAHITR